MNERLSYPKPFQYFRRNFIPQASFPVSVTTALSSGISTASLRFRSAIPEAC